MELFRASILTDPSRKRLAATMDRFGYYLATNEGKKGKLARNTAMSYYRNVKLWLFDEFPHLRPLGLVELAGNNEASPEQLSQRSDSSRSEEGHVSVQMAKAIQDSVNGIIALSLVSMMDQFQPSK
jgi:hypothetical protein